MSDQMEYFKSKYQTLEDLPGVGPATAIKLREIGFKTVEALATAPPRHLISEGIGKDTAEKIVAAARKALAITFVTAEEYREMLKALTKMTTGCASLDELLVGGLPTMSITEFHGEFGTGKSQMCQQLAATVQLPVDQGGLDGSCLYIDTEQVFRPDRVLEIAERLGLDDSVLKKIVFAEAYTSAHQMILLESADEIIKENNVRLIIVDSLTGHFRSEYIGRENLAPRQQLLNKHMHKLIRLARAFNAAVVVTNQVSDVPDSRAGYRIQKPIGGNIVGHIAHTRILIRKGRDNLRIAKIIASPFLPVGEAPMTIGNKGFTGEAQDVVFEG